MMPTSRQDEPTRSSGAAAGFTLLELLVVVLILAIAAMIVVPRAARSDTFEVQGAARTIVSDLLYAQNEAIARQQTRKVIFDVAGNSYRLTDAADTALSAAWLGGTYQVAFGSGSRFPTVSIQSVSFTNTTLTFDELGTPSAGGTINVTAGSLVYQITVTAFTGRITVTQISGE